MRPGLRHAVWTAEDSVCLVGDLYLPGMMMSRELASTDASDAHVRLRVLERVQQADQRGRVGSNIPQVSPPAYRVLPRLPRLSRLFRACIVVLKGAI